MSEAKFKIPSISKRELRKAANLGYFVCLFGILFFVFIGIWITANSNGEQEAKFHAYGGFIQKYPWVNRYIVVTKINSDAREQGLRQARLLTIEGCDSASYSSLADLFACAGIDQKEQVTLEVVQYGERQMYSVKLEENAGPIEYNLLYYSIDSFFVLISFALSLLLFFKGKRYISGYLVSLTVLLNVCESAYFYFGSNILSSAILETLRLNLTFIVGPLALFFFPQGMREGFLRSPFFIAIAFCIAGLIYSYHFLTYAYVQAIILFTLFVLIMQFIIKYRSVLSDKERKQVTTMLFCLIVGLIFYVPLYNFAGQYGRVIGRYLLPCSVGFGVFIALIRYRLWQVDSLVSKSATLSILSIIAFSAWAGLDQGLQVLLNQTIGLSNKSFTAFLAAAISSMFVVPLYKYIASSCDAFFNKELHQLKRLLSKEILVLADIQKLSVFVENVGDKLCELTGANKLGIEFNDHNRQSEPFSYVTQTKAKLTEDSVVHVESFSYHIDNTLSVVLNLEFLDRNINKDIKRELEDGIDEIARALACCSRWNYLEAMGIEAGPLMLKRPDLC